MIRLALGENPSTPDGNAIVGSSLLFSIRIDFVFVAHIYNLTKFSRFHKAQSGNMCKVDHQVLSCVKVLSEATYTRSGKASPWLIHIRQLNKLY